jgi:hypothetical protein
LIPRAPHLFALLLLGGCTAWGGTLTVEGIPASPPPEKAFQLWRDSTVTELHTVRVDGDTIRGVPAARPRDCDTCVVAIAKTEVDSVRVREFNGGKTRLVIGLTTWFLIVTDILFQGLDQIFDQ